MVSTLRVSCWRTRLRRLSGYKSLERGDDERGEGAAHNRESKEGGSRGNRGGGVTSWSGERGERGEWRSWRRGAECGCRGRRRSGVCYHGDSLPQHIQGAITTVRHPLSLSLSGVKKGEEG